MSTLPDVGSERRPALEATAAALYERHRRRLVAFCTAQMGSREEAEDAVQDTFVYAMRALQRGVVPENELAWLFTIARNVCHVRRRNGFRRSRTVVTRDLNALNDVIPAEEHDHDRLHGLPEALASIPDTQRQAILLREWQGLSYREIARQLELSHSAVETLLFRARRSLAQALARSGKTAASALNLPALIGVLRSLLAGGTANIGAGALTIAAAATLGAVTVPAVAGDDDSHRRPPAARVTPARAPTAVTATGSGSVGTRAPGQRPVRARPVATADRAPVAPAPDAAPSAPAPPADGGGDRLTPAAAGADTPVSDPPASASASPAQRSPRSRPERPHRILPVTPPAVPVPPPPVVEAPPVALEPPAQVEAVVDAATGSAIAAVPLPAEIPAAAPTQALPAAPLP